MKNMEEVLRMALEALLTTGSETDAYGVTRQWHDEEAVDNAITAIREALAAPRVSECPAAAPQRDQSDWDEVPKAFNEWWDKDYDGHGNPFSFDSPAYWAWAGWKSAAPQTTGNIVMDSYKQMVAMKEAATQGEPITDTELINQGCRYTTELTNPAPAPLSKTLDHSKWESDLKQMAVMGNFPED